MLSLQPFPSIPAETARIARAAFPKDRPYLAAADALGQVITDDAFVALFPRRSQPALAPWRLARDVPPLYEAAFFVGCCQSPARIAAHPHAGVSCAVGG